MASVTETTYTPSSPERWEASAFDHFRKSVPALTDDELVRRVNGDFSAAFWRRYNILAAKLHAETMTDAEQQKFKASLRCHWKNGFHFNSKQFNLRRT